MQQLSVNIKCTMLQLDKIMASSTNTDAWLHALVGRLQLKLKVGIQALYGPMSKLGDKLHTMFRFLSECCQKMENDHITILSCDSIIYLIKPSRY